MPQSRTLRRGRPRRRLVVVLSATCLLLALGASPASAHGTKLPAPGGGGHGGVTDSHRFAYACDYSYDFVRISNTYTYYYAGKFYTNTVTAPNGGCKQVGVAGPIVKYQVCREPGHWCNHQSRP
jgi:hypothetical protein